MAELLNLISASTKVATGVTRTRGHSEIFEMRLFEMVASIVKSMTSRFGHRDDHKIEDIVTDTYLRLTQSTFDPEHPGAHSYIRKIARSAISDVKRNEVYPVMLTQKTIATLREDCVPDSILSILTSMIDAKSGNHRASRKIFRNKITLRKKLLKNLGSNLFNQYGSMILDRSEPAPFATRQELLLATIPSAAVEENDRYEIDIGFHAAIAEAARRDPDNYKFWEARRGGLTYEEIVTKMAPQMRNHAVEMRVSRFRSLALKIYEAST